MAILKKKNEPPQKEAEKPKVETVVASAKPSGTLCDCGQPVAEGQTYVCKSHIRSA